MTTLVIKL